MAKAERCGFMLGSNPSRVGRLGLLPKVPKALESDCPFMRYAAVCKAVAAADLRAACARAVASLVAQSGLILSVVITSGALAEIEVPRRLPGPGDMPEEDNDVCEDIADIS